MSNDASCGNCRYAYREEPQQEQLACRRFPPTVRIDVQFSVGISTVTTFPSMMPHGWCGEHRPRTEGLQ